MDFKDHQGTTWRLPSFQQVSRIVITCKTCGRKRPLLQDVCWCVILRRASRWN